MKMKPPENSSALLREGQLERLLQVGRRHLDRYYPYMLGLVFNEGQITRYSPVYFRRYAETLPRIEKSSLPRIKAFAASDEGRQAAAEGVEDFNAALNLHLQEDDTLTVKAFRDLANLSLNTFVKWEDADTVATEVVKHKRRIGIEAIQGLATWQYPIPQEAPADQLAVWSTQVWDDKGLNS